MPVVSALLAASGCSGSTGHGAGGPCSDCHGGARNAAPPRDTAGNRETALMTVGAHQKHLRGGNWHRAVVCEDCHVVPTTVDAPGHRDAAPAEVTWGALARADGANPGFDASSGTCAGVYCHGATLPAGGSNTHPVWTQVDGAQTACGTCHGLPPASPHPDSYACGNCHGMVVDNRLRWVDPSLHINGVVNVSDTNCSNCHGSTANAAPPVDTQARSSSTLLTVGAHQSHLRPSDWHRDILCTDCHVVPGAVGDPGHIDAAPAEITWGSLAVSDSASPSFNRQNATCSGVYCHGATLLPGGTSTAPTWTTVNGTQAACGTCHGLPPAAPHPSSTRCSDCHGMVVTESLGFVDPSLHIDGTVQVSSQTCGSCHGGTTNAAPPVDTQGLTATTEVTVGAHQSHLRSSTWHRNVQCADCHVVPAASGDPGHIDAAPAEVTWGALAVSDSASPSFNRQTATCSGVYCHGATLLSGGTRTAPTWTTVDGTQASCGTCHGLPPAAPHPSSTRCSDCHGMVVDQNRNFVDASLHINGTVDVIDVSCSTCHGGSTNAAPPLDTQGGVATTAVTVGAHQSHLRASTWHRDVQCADCHVVPLAVGDAGHIDTAPAEVTWGSMARADSATPAFNRTAATCSGVYCHGATLLPGGTNNRPTWTTVNGTQAACGTCHGLPPATPHPNSTACSTCHGMVVDQNRNFVDPTRHLNGVVDVIDVSCSTCHGGATNAAPPLDTQGGSATSLVTVGAHQSHLRSSTWHRDLQCGDCHVVPATVTSPGHIDTAPAEVVWGAMSQADGATPAFNRGTGSCSGVYCHGATLLAGGSNSRPTWTTVNGTQAACGTCHGLPPSVPHPSSTQCSDCHGMVVDQNRNFLDPARHLNGVVDVIDVSCSTCHGGPSNAAPPPDTQGLTATAAVTVGAHQSHLGTSTWHREVLCTDCHIVPATVNDAGHLDPSPAEVRWGSLAQVDGATPSFNRTSATCSGVYCHGSTLGPGAAYPTPTWTVVNGIQAACGGCHGLPPPAPHPAQSDCGTCHGESYDGTNFVNPALHIDGVVQVNGSCDSCHGNPPTPANESYAGAGGAHTKHSVELGLACSVCHGHDGSGPSHNEAGGTVVRGNVDIVFDATIAFPGGTTMRNGGVPSESYGGGRPTCYVGCHNPIPGDSRDLNNPAVWTDTSIGCQECHDRPGIVAPENHAISGTDAVVRANCETCHDTAAHLSGAVAMKDPDPTDAYSHAAQGIDGLCWTCHDGGTGTFFGGQSPPDVSAFWRSPASHRSAGQNCSTCHGYHGSTSSPDLGASREEDLCLTCHDGGTAATDIASIFDRPSRHPVVDAEQQSFAVECVDCHNPHADTAAAPFVADPDPTDAVSPTGLNSAYCLTCHDGQQATSKTTFTASAHGTEGMTCGSECHVLSAGVGGAVQSPLGPHGSPFPALTTAFEESLCGDCHAEALEMSNAGTFTHHHVVDAEQTAAQPVECQSCHDPHVAKSSPWQPLTDPHTGALVAAGDVPADSSVNPTQAARDTGRFCLRCHDGSWPGAINISAELASRSTIRTGFYNNDGNLHRLHRSYPNNTAGQVACDYCHNAHGSTGTSGVRRGALLYNWINVRRYPYTSKDSCGTGDPLHRCH